MARIIFRATTPTTLITRFASRRSIASNPVLCYPITTNRHKDTAIHKQTYSTGHAASDGNSEAKGRTGRGEQLGRTTPGARSMPKVFNSSMPSDGTPNNLNEEQEQEVDEHNKSFKKASESGQKEEDEKDKNASKGQRGFIRG